MSRLATLLLIAFALTVSFCSGKKPMCKQKEYVLLGGDIAIDCQLEEFYIVFWYKDNPSNPIAKLEGGRKFISENAQQHYDISENGALVITDVTEEQYDDYELTVRYTDGSVREESVQLNEAVAPHQSCPNISPCDTCTCVNPENNKFHNVTCSLHGSRPQIKLELSAEDSNHNQLNVSGVEEIVEYNNRTDTYNVVISTGFYLQECNMSVAVHCRVSEHNLFSLDNSTIFLFSETCTSPIPLGRKWILPVTVITVFTILIVVVALILYIIVRRQRQSSTDKEDPQRSQEEMQTLKSPLVKNSRKSEKDTISRLLPYLEERYKQMHHVKPVPWGEDIPIESMYIDTLCEVSDEKRKFNDNLSNIFLQRLYPSHADPSEKEADDLVVRTLVVGDLGYGKTTLMQYLSSQWAKKSRKEQEKEIMFLIPLKDFKSHDSVADAICRTLPSDLDISKTDLINLFNRRRCLLLLDGLDELHKSDGQRDLVNGDENSLTIDSILNNTPKRALSNLRICVTSRNVENANMFSRPYTKVTLLPLTDQHVKAYIEKTIAYNWDIYSNCPNNEQTINYTDERQLAKAVKDVLDSHDLIVDFKKSPYLMMMFIHIVLHKLMNIGDDDCLTQIDLGKLSSLVAAITVCLERRYKQKFQQTAFDTLKENLGKISLKPSTGSFITYWNFNDIETSLGSEMNTALAVGYIKRTALTENDKVSHIHDLSWTTFPGVVFIHDYIQEYCVAWYISKHKHEKISTFIKTVIGASEESMRHRRVLQFVSAIDPSLSSKVLDGLTDKRCWDTVIDFLYEYRNGNEVKALQKSQLRFIEVIRAKQSEKPRVFVKNLHRKNHRDAFEFFCKTCRESNIKLESLTFTSDCTVEYLLQLELPFVESITLREMNLTDEYFKEVLVWTCVKTKISSLIFSKSIIPEKVDVETLLQHKERKLKKMQNIVSSSGGGHELNELNWKDGTWTWKSYVNPAIKV